MARARSSEGARWSFSGSELVGRNCMPPVAVAVLKYNKRAGWKSKRAEAEQRSSGNGAIMSLSCQITSPPNVLSPWADLETKSVYFEHVDKKPSSY